MKRKCLRQLNQFIYNDRVWSFGTSIFPEIIRTKQKKTKKMKLFGILATVGLAKGMCFFLIFQKIYEISIEGLFENGDFRTSQNSFSDQNDGRNFVYKNG